MLGTLKALLLLGCCLQVLVIRVYAELPDWVPRELIEIIKPDKIKCMQKHGTTEEMIDEVNQGSLQNDPRITCYMNCLFDSFGLVDDDGELEVEMFVGIMPENIQPVAQEILAKCADKQGADSCDKMYQIGKCVQEYRPEYWFMI